MLNGMLSFDKLITPKIMVFIYWLSIVFTVLGVFISLFAGEGFTFLKLIMSIVSLIVSLIFIRVFFEIIIIAFKNNEYLRRMTEVLENKNQ
ncbi:DUF4282 domain-containing protein [Enterobacillus tribolii]|uniref:Uncharacterized protein DUF4282 n=1 Tax=Enterobacillus tribolii TaxID=1487935 RepID=A0A370QRA0_9GAMM|nr:DUF4282 domain-containing protein [Enterobacillus tribolii]MBW7981570.1 DUF4282 domain-containing protein [Enterobacillus tribolii]RDK90947.1 uncharacterized protein DUF4282 [Enterobacillus tribolii]